MGVEGGEVTTAAVDADADADAGFWACKWRCDAREETWLVTREDAIP